jgi:hypothetical protein
MLYANGYQQGYGQQPMTPPMINAVIIQIARKDEMDNYTMNIGQSQMFMLRDESAIFIKSRYANGQYGVDEYTRKPPEPEKPAVQYVTKGELEQMLSGFVRKEKTTDDAV